MDYGYDIGLFYGTAFQASLDNGRYQTGYISLWWYDPAGLYAPAHTQLLQYCRVVRESDNVGVGPETG